MKTRTILKALALASLMGTVPALADPLPPPQQPSKPKKKKSKDGDKKPDDEGKTDPKTKS